MVVGQKRPVAGHSADRVIVWHGSGLAQRLFRAPEMEVFHCALGEVLALGDRLRRGMALHDQDFHISLGKLDSKPHSDWATACDDDLVHQAPFHTGTDPASR
jgi:hypothetical protein